MILINLNVLIDQIIMALLPWEMIMRYELFSRQNIQHFYIRFCNDSYSLTGDKVRSPCIKVCHFITNITNFFSANMNDQVKSLV